MRTRRPPMTPLRQRMVEDMQLRNFSAQTIRAYLHCVAAFAQHFHTSPEHLGPEHVRTYQLFLVQDKQRAWPTVVQTVCALRDVTDHPTQPETSGHPHHTLCGGVARV